MFEFFRRLRRRRSEAAFRGRTLSILQELFPREKFAKGSEPDVILVNGGTCSIRNLHARVSQISVSTSEEREMIRCHFKAAIRGLTDLTETSWEDVRTRVRPQLGSPELLNEMPLAHLSLTDGLVKYMVIDGDTAYRYVTAQDIMDWRVTWEEVDVHATANLNEFCDGKTPIHFVPGPDRIIAVQTMDSFDAARILIPDFRAFVASKLGAPFLFGVPNRDFLICWSHDNSENFFKLTAERLRVDFRNMPYPISPEVFEASRSSVRLWKH